MSLETNLPELLIVTAPAKINLRLKVTGRRADGYHILSMLNVTTDLCDLLRIRFLEGASSAIVVEGESWLQRGVDLANNDNLAVRAAAALFEAFDVPLAVSITLTKRIPLGAGLGGGSSDAAAALSALFGALGLADQPGSRGKLLAVATRLGADVPYLLEGGLALVSGIGETVERLPSGEIEGWECWIFVPPFGCDTREVFANLRAERPRIDSWRDEEAIAFARAARESGSASRDELLASAVNDLELVAARMHPELSEMLARLRIEPYLHAAMSGSGSALFALPRFAFEFDEPARERLGALARSMGTAVLTCRICAKRPSEVIANSE